MRPAGYLLYYWIQIMAVVIGMATLPACSSPVSIGRIAFYSSEAGKYGAGKNDIYVINADGSGLVRLAKNARLPVWSPDGQQIAFNGLGVDVMNVDGSHKMTLISSPEGHYSPATWSADGRRIAFEHINSLNGRIYIIDVENALEGNASDPMPLLLAGDMRGPIWSPDGQKIAFFVLGDHHDPFEIGVTSPDGNAWEILTEGVDMSWSPDSQHIAFVSDRGEQRGIYIMNADGSSQTHLADNALSPIWSPDGQRIAFISYRDSNVEIYIMDSDGSNQTRLTNNPADDTSPAWSPDGKQIAFVSKRDGNQEIYVMNADGSNQTRLTNTPEDEWNPVWQPR